MWLEKTPLQILLSFNTARASLTVRRHPADLGPGGEIIFEGLQFKSPSAFSVHVKRKQNPGRKADDGWYAHHKVHLKHPKDASCRPESK